MTALIHLLQEVTEIPFNTLALILAFCAMACYFIREHLVVPGLIVVLYPLMGGLAIGANYGLTKVEFFELAKYDQWLICSITSATIGVVGALLISAAMARVLEHFQTNRKITGA